MLPTEHAKLATTPPGCTIYGMYIYTYIYIYIPYMVHPGGVVGQLQY
jgi:hypothetical protein